MRATICVDVGRPDEELLAACWFESWLDELSYVSKDQGCGCCVRIHDVEGTEAAISALPLQVASGSEWMKGHGEASKTDPVQNPFRSAIKAKHRREPEHRKRGNGRK